MARSLPFGSWPSLLSAADAAAGSARFDGASFASGEAYWAQSVGGRMTVFRQHQEQPLLPEPFNVRSRVHMYGGGAWTVTADGTVFFVEASDQRVWVLPPGEAPRALTPACEATTYGGLTLSAGVLLAVRERRLPGGIERDIVMIAPRPDADEPIVSLASGTDFVAQPALSPDAANLAWVGWNHPDMPWDHADVYVRSLVTEGHPFSVSQGAGVQPQWSARGDLFFADDRTGRWNLRAVPAGSATSLPIAPADADTGGALWVLGLSWYRLLEDGRILAVRTDGGDRLVVISPDGEREVSTPLSAGIMVHDVDGTRALVSGAGERVPGGIWVIDVDDEAVAHAVAGGVAAWPDEWLPRAEPMTFAGPQGDVHAFFYTPTNPRAEALPGALPPALVMVHGGPSDHTSPALSPTITYFTSRGIAVCEVNYGGSTGYGRAYRERLRGQWGVVDVADVVAAADALAASGLVDANRIAVRGGSAGGWTVLNALARTDRFAAGIARYPVTDARALASDDGEFESRYFDGLIGPLPEANDLYVERSPLTHAAEIKTPVLLEQGTDDPVVPQSQPEMIRDALAANRVPHAYLLFEGEGHGFRRPETLVASLEAELGLLSTVFGFEADVPPLTLS